MFFSSSFKLSLLAVNLSISIFLFKSSVLFSASKSSSNSKPAFSIADNSFSSYSYRFKVAFFKSLISLPSSSTLGINKSLYTSADLTDKSIPSFIVFFKLFINSVSFLFKALIIFLLLGKSLTA